MKNKVWVVKSGRPEVGMSVVPESSGVLVASKVPEVAIPCANQFLTLQNMEDLVSEVDRTEQGLPVDLGSSSSGLGDIPVIDLVGFRDSSSRRSVTVNDIGNACRHYGFFQIVNHGIDQFVLDGALSSAFDFFSLPTEEKSKLMSNDVHNPVRYATSLKDGVDKIQFSRAFLKHYAYPLEDWVKSWPENPPASRYIFRFQSFYRNPV
ncbi:hypothetical protein RHGRI_029291 [Rhododendron griersonianum]|uniref:Non-haem dioxygenase N-terminal domain-containing protein n=1 Tax=Rhododendron griersonianum TaxID=479676 RepID=A0AAV6IM79_9ERIC|nr:hypothetical protein RHGRI_029291 [Rhododendron griersonianum]